MQMTVTPHSRWLGVARRPQTWIVHSGVGIVTQGAEDRGAEDRGAERGAEGRGAERGAEGRGAEPRVLALGDVVHLWHEFVVENLGSSDLVLTELAQAR
jgi:hypothetical protein